MSENIRGITFAEQAVTPADDAVVRRAILGDGTLTGCEISYSGSTLTMAAGYIIACGRTFQVTAAQNWAVVDSTSGVARLLLTIDLTKTATEDAFNQIEFSIEYAPSQDGFVDLVQEDVNLAGTRYQIAACVVSLGTGGITGIVSKLEKTEAGGGVNFSVVGGLTQPAGQKENTIWVNTDTRITSYIFSPTEPESPAADMVWIFTGDSSSVAFSATKKNPVMVYPISAKQYISGAWVKRTAKIYQNGRWHSLGTYIVQDGVAKVDFSGNLRGGRDDKMTVAAKTGYLDVIVQDSFTMGPATKQKVNVTSFSTLTLECEAVAIPDYIAVCLSSALGASTSNAVVQNIVASKATTAIGRQTIECKIDGYSGDYYVGVLFYDTASQTYTRQIKIYNLFLS